MEINKASIMRITLLAVISTLFASAAFAQSKYTEDADIAYKRGGFYEAAQAYKIAYQKVDGLDEKGRVLFRIGESYRLMTDNAGAEEWYEKAIEARYYKKNPEVYFQYAEVLREQEKFDDAVVQYQKYQERGGDASKAQIKIDACETAAMHIDIPPSRYLVEPVVLLNSPFFDYAPTWSSKKNDEIVFSSSRQSAVGGNEDPITGESFMDLFASEQDKKGKCLCIRLKSLQV